VDNLILEELKTLKEDNYKIFNKKIIPTKQEMLGVRLPALRKIAKRIAKEEPLIFINSSKGKNYEMIMLEGMVLSYMDKDFTELQPLIEIFLKKVDNWAQIDSVIPKFKLKDEKSLEKALKITKKWLESNEEFIVRAGIIMLLAHYMKKENLKMIFALSQKIKHTGYYVQMANAWLISVCMAKFPVETIEFFKNNTLDNFTHNKAIQKSRESRRVSDENKVFINGLKK